MSETVDSMQELLVSKQNLPELSSAVLELDVKIIIVVVGIHFNSLGLAVAKFTPLCFPGVF